jgi:SAM-dependent methyltransferase
MNEPEVITVDYEGSDLEALSTLHRYQRWIIDGFQPYLGGQAIEFGAGIGNISFLVRPLVTSLDLVEPSINLCKPLRQRFDGDEAISISHELLETRIPNIKDKQYDCVVLVNVLEHIEDDIAALKGLYRILKPGGHLLIFVPALKFLFSDMDARVGHFRRYQHPELKGRVAGAGFNIIKSKYFDFLGIIAWWVLNTKMGSTDFNPMLASIYDAIFVPTSRVIESVIRPPIGKNILLVAKRPEKI